MHSCTFTPAGQIVIDSNGINISETGNFIGSVISTVGAPANAIALYNEKSDFKLNLCLSTGWSLLKSDFSTLYQAKGSVSILSYIVTEVFEFKSFDGSGKYNELQDGAPISSFKYKYANWVSACKLTLFISFQTKNICFYPFVGTNACIDFRFS
jgi:hypothetical protein